MSPPTGTPRPSGHPPLDGISSSWQNSNTSLPTRTTKPLGSSRRQPRQQEDTIDLQAPALAGSRGLWSVDSAERTALNGIGARTPTSITQRGQIQRRLAGDGGPAERLRQLLEASKRARATSQAETDKAAAISHAAGPGPANRYQNPSVGTSNGLGEKAKRGLPAPNLEVIDTRQGKPADKRSTSPNRLDKAIRLECAVMINDNEVMGNPFGYPSGWVLKVNLDPGVEGQPSIGLDFEFPVASVNASEVPDHKTFSVGWEPGVKVGGEWMMRDLRIWKATRPSNPELFDTTFPLAIHKLLENAKGRERAFLLSNLVCASFRSNVHKSSPMRTEWALALNGDAGQIPYANLQSMYDGEATSYQVTLWFVHRNLSLKQFHAGWLGPLVDAVADHTPPFHQYLTGNGMSTVDFNLESLPQITSGAYRQYPRVLDRTCRKVESRKGKLIGFCLPKTVTWESIKTLHSRFPVQEREIEQGQVRPSTPRVQRGSGGARVPPRKPTKARKPPAEREMSRLQDRHSLHRLAPS